MSSLKARTEAVKCYHNIFISINSIGLLPNSQIKWEKVIGDGEIEPKIFS
ncbi:MAG: hypothetical protein ACETWM_01085 [Candidatus Lokiarchaeia archaeon]